MNTVNKPALDEHATERWTLVEGLNRRKKNLRHRAPIPVGGGAPRLTNMLNHARLVDASRFDIDRIGRFPWLSMSEPRSFEIRVIRLYKMVYIIYRPLSRRAYAVTHRDVSACRKRRVRFEIEVGCGRIRKIQLFWCADRDESDR